MHFIKMIKTMDLNVSGTKKDVALKQRPDRFPSIGDHIQVTPTFEQSSPIELVTRNEIVFLTSS